MKKTEIFKSNIFSYLLPVIVLVIIPVVIFSLTGLPFTQFAFIIVLGALIITAGLILLVWSIILMERAGKGTLAPWAPASVMLTKGPYKHIRNPMISGVLYCLFGIWLISWNHWLLAWTVFFFIGNVLYFKLSEEPGLVKRFGAEYIEYRKKTPMWIPKFK